MSAPKSAVSKAVNEVREAAQELDLRRQKQIANQAAIIDRLMDGATYDDTFRETVESLSETQVRLDAALAEIRELSDA